MRHRLASARAAMQDKYDGLCALVNKQGMCHQCKGLSDVARGFGGKPGPLPDVAELSARMAIVREMRDRPVSDIHALFFRQVEAIEEAGTGSVVPETDCGQVTDS
jgi:RNA polymerase sigma-70 factor, ECF subfamily